MSILGRGNHDVYLYKQAVYSGGLNKLAVKELRLQYTEQDSLKETISDLTQRADELKKKFIAIRGLDHRNLLRYYDFTCQQIEGDIPRFLIVMEYCQGTVIILQLLMPQ